MTEQESYKELANAIILQAVADYRIGRDQYSIERFFESAWFDTLARNCVSGKEVLKLLREEDDARTSRLGL